MDYVKDYRVDAYIDALPDWQQELCQRLRDLIHAADPKIEETVKRTVQPYFVLHGNVCALLAAKDRLNLFIYDGGDPIRAAALTRFLRRLIVDNRRGGWRAIKMGRPAPSRSRMHR